jgi:hypothetical protein
MRLIQSHLVNLSSAKRENGPDDLLRTYDFYHGPPTYAQSSKESFLFGETDVLDVEEIRTKVHDIRTKVHDIITGREIIIVIHGGQNVLRLLDTLNLVIRPLYILYTQKAARYPLPLTQRPSLKSPLTALDIPFGSSSLHVSGNHANFTLRSLLMVAVVDSERREDPVMDNILY